MSFIIKFTQQDIAKMNSQVLKMAGTDSESIEVSAGTDDGVMFKTTLSEAQIRDILKGGMQHELLHSRDPNMVVEVYRVIDYFNCDTILRKVCIKEMTIKQLSDTFPYLFSELCGTFSQLRIFNEYNSLDEETLATAIPGTRFMHLKNSDLARYPLIEKYATYVRSSSELNLTGFANLKELFFEFHMRGMEQIDASVLSKLKSLYAKDMIMEMPIFDVEMNHLEHLEFINSRVAAIICAKIPNLKTLICPSSTNFASNTIENLTLYGHFKPERWQQIKTMENLKHLELDCEAWVDLFVFFPSELNHLRKLKSVCVANEAKLILDPNVCSADIKNLRMVKLKLARDFGLEVKT